MKAPRPEPLDVVLSEVVGLALVDQQTPLTVTDPPPSSVTLPPDDAVVGVIDVTALVVTVGNCIAEVVNDTWFP